MISALAISGMIRWAHRWYDPLVSPPAAHIAQVIAKLALNSVSPR